MKKIVSIFLALFLASCGSYQSAGNSTTAKSGTVSETGSQQVPAQLIPNDTYFFPNQWGMHNTGDYAYGYPDNDIDAPEAWSITYPGGNIPEGSKNVVIAVIDTGIDYNHSDLVGNIWTNLKEQLGDYNDDGCPGVCGADDDGDGLIDEALKVPGILAFDDDENGYPDDIKGYDFYNTDNDPMDTVGHGTHVAGIVGAHGNNGEGVTGVMWRVKLMPLKIFDVETIAGKDEVIAASDENIAEAIRYAVDNGAKVINASWGSLEYYRKVYDAIDYANTNGVLFVASAGNGREDGLGGIDFVGDNNDLFPHYPASFDLPNIISVAATDQRDQRVPFSNYGPLSVDIAAPGVYIWSTVPNWMSTFPDFGRLETLEGASMAAAHVSGLAGLLIGYYDGVQNTQFAHYDVRNTILRYVDWLSSLDGWIATNGRINAYKAVSSLLTPTGLTAKANPFKIPNPSLPSDAIADSPSITLSWADNATSYDRRYKIERRSDGNFVEIANDIGPDSTTYTDSAGLEPTTSYTYRIRVYNKIANSSYSEVAVAETLSDGEGIPHGGGGCSITAGKDAGRVDLLVMLLPVAAILTLIKRRKR
ncbi:MAG: S8 family serine peptidase [Nitrospirae bacterium]|nr:S8 family serine peptidase [Nitrospirota bacterium]